MFHCDCTAFIQVEVKAPSFIKSAGKALSKIEQVQEVHYLAGGDALMVKLKISGNKELSSVIQDQIAAIEGICATQTSIAISTFKESAKIRLPDQI
jgi:Lrp/AsnC family leucine-responsive transcriptional regulator